MDAPDFLLAVITAPGEIAGEAGLLEGMLDAGAGRVHLRKPGGSVEGLAERLAARWASRLVLHGSEELARKYGITQVHAPVGPGAGRRAQIRRSTSVHSWEELTGLPEELEYAFISPLFDSISKPGYGATPGLLDMPDGPYPCRPVGLGGVNADNIVLMLSQGWKGAALLGCLWQAPDEAVKRFEQIKRIVDG